MSSDDWSWEDVGEDHSSWCYLAQIEYTTAATPETEPETKRVYWSGPREVISSGVTTTIDPTDEARFLSSTGWSPDMVYWEPRLSKASLSRTFGSITTHVQPATSFRMDVNVDGLGEPDLLSDLLTGRWANKSIRVWFFNTNRRTAILRFDGLLDRNPTSVTLGGFRIAASQRPGFDHQWPMTKMPDSEAPNGGLNSYGPYSRIEECAVGGPGGLTDAFHPGVPFIGNTPNGLGYHIPERHRGTLIPPLFGGNPLTNDGIYRELIYYGYNSRPDVGSGIFHFFHVSAQFNCYVDKIWWSKNDGSVASAVDPGTSITVVNVMVFNNYNEQWGPVGTNVRLATTTAFTDSFYGQNANTCMGRCYGPDTGKEQSPVLASLSVPEYPQIKTIGYTTYGSTHSSDDAVLELIFSDMLDMSNVFVTGALATFANSAPFGPTGSMDWRRFQASVPLKAADEPPQLRGIIGDLAMASNFDIAYKLDPITNAVRMAPVRRRPCPGDMAPDWIIQEGDPIQIYPAAWTHLDDADGVYANEVSVKSPEYLEEPLAGASGTGVINPGNIQFIKIHDDDIEQLESRHGGVKYKSISMRYWTPTSDTGATDAYEFIGENLSQPQRGVRIVLGKRHYEMELGDVVAYDLSGLYKSPGQIRELSEEWDDMTLEVYSVHIVFLESAQPRGNPGALREEVEDKGKAIRGIVTKPKGVDSEAAAGIKAEHQLSTISPQIKGTSETK